MCDSEWAIANGYISKSRCTAFDFCPYQYKKSYIDGQHITSYAMTIGSRLHHWFEIFYDHCDKVTIDEWDIFITSDYSTYERVMLERFIADEKIRFQRLNYNYAEFIPRARELKVVNHNLKIRGIIDRITDDRTVLEDYRAFLVDAIETGSCSGPRQVDSYFKTIQDIVSGKLNKIVCIEEYKTSATVYEKSLKFEFGFYKLLLKELPEYKDAFMVGRVINPRVNTRKFIPIQQEVYVTRKIAALRKAIEDNNFPKECRDDRFIYCGRCSIDECGLYDNCHDTRFNIDD